MKKNLVQTLLITTILTATLAVHPAQAQEKGVPQLIQVTSFDHQVTGVTVSKDGRIFVNFPRWNEDVPVSVAEVTKEGIKPYPNDEWNEWRNEKKDKISPKDHFVCVQSVVIDQQDNLWVLDPASPGNERVVQDGPKLVKIDLGSNQVVKTISFDDKVAPTGSYLNDIRFSNDGKYGYITDSGQAALVVVDLVNGTARRVLEKDVSTMAEKGVVVKTDGKELRRPDGRAPEFHADGIALSADGNTLYWQALTGRTLYSIPTAALRDKKMTAATLKTKIKKVGENGIADGLWLDKKDVMYVTSPQDNSVKKRNGSKDPVIWVQDDRLRWPDTLSQDAKGAIYVTTSHIQDSPMFKPGADKAVKTELWKITE